MKILLYQAFNVFFMSTLHEILTCINVYFCGEEPRQEFYNWAAQFLTQAVELVNKTLLFTICKKK